MPSRQQIVLDLEDLNDDAVAHVAEVVRELRTRPSCCRRPGQRLRLVSDTGPGPVVVRMSQASLQTRLADVMTQHLRLVEAVRQIKLHLLKARLDAETPVAAPQATR